GRTALIEMCKELGGVDGLRANTAELVARVSDAIERGHLRVDRVPLRLSLWTSRKQEEDVRPSERAETIKTTWIALEVVDADGDPMPFQRYSIELPDGSLREGMVDDNGRARIDGIDDGNCKVRFPDVDGRDWKKA